MSNSGHSFPIRVYYEDTDAGGVVYYANYLKFAERARTEALRAAGIEQTALRESHGILFVVRHVDIDFLKPAKLDDLLTVESTLQKISNVKIIIAQTISRDGKTLAKLTVTLAVINDAFKLAKLPDSIKKAMQKIFD